MIRSFVLTAAAAVTMSALGAAQTHAPAADRLTSFLQTVLDLGP